MVDLREGIEFKHFSNHQHYKLCQQQNIIQYTQKTKRKMEQRQEKQHKKHTPKNLWIDSGKAINGYTIIQFACLFILAVR